MNKMTFFIQRLIRLCYYVIIFLICCHIYNFVGYNWILWIRFVYFTIWSLYKSIWIYPCISSQRVNQTDVWRSEEHTSELQSRFDLVCRLLLEKNIQYDLCDIAS